MAPEGRFLHAAWLTLKSVLTALLLFLVVLPVLMGTKSGFHLTPLGSGGIVLALAAMMWIKWDDGRATALVIGFIGLLTVVLAIGASIDALPQDCNMVRRRHRLFRHAQNLALMVGSPEPIRFLASLVGGGILVLALRMLRRGPGVY